MCEEKLKIVTTSDQTRAAQTAVERGTVGPAIEVLAIGEADTVVRVRWGLSVQGAVCRESGRCRVFPTRANVNFRANATSRTLTPNF